MEAHIAGLKVAEEKLQELYIQFEQECIQKMLARTLRGLVAWRREGKKGVMVNG